MSELAFQTAFAKLLIDEETRAAAFAGAPLPGLALSEVEAARLHGLDRERVAVYSELLVMNRLAKAMEALPFTTKALGSNLWAVTLEWNRASPTVQAKKYDEARSFAHYLLGTLGSRPDQPAYLRDLVLYEMSRLELRYTAVQDLPDAASERTPAQIELALGSGAASVYPRQLPHSRVLAFDHDIEAIVHELDQGQTPAQVEPQPSHMLMIVDPSGMVQQFAANLPTVAFVTAATGDKSFAELLTWLAQVFGQEQGEAFQALTAACVELCTSLIDQGVIALFERPIDRRTAVGLH